MSDASVETVSAGPVATVTYKGCTFNFIIDDNGIGGWYTGSHRPRCFPFAYTKGIKVPVSDPTSNGNLWQILGSLALEQGITVAVYSGSISTEGEEEGEAKPAKKKGKVSLSKSSQKLNNFTPLF